MKGMENKPDEVEKKRVYSAEELEKGICPKCGGELIGTAALAFATGIFGRWECMSCSFVAKAKTEVDPKKRSNPT